MKKWIWKYLDSRPRTEIWIKEERYLTKWYLGRFLGLKWNLHRFDRPDFGRAVHSHPWNVAYSFILKGSYWEQVVEGVDTAGELVYTERHRKWFNKLDGMSLHRIVALTRDRVWTLFAMGERQQHWGFLSKKGTEYWQYVPYEEMQDASQYSLDFGYFEAIRK